MKKMSNKSGFTLIELLAVIVILAIIALIATPIVMNIIEDSKKGAAERSSENYFKQVQTEVASSYSNPTNKIKDGVYYIQVDESGNPTGKITDNYKEYDIEMSGTKPTEGTLYIKNGQVMNGSYLKINNNIVNYVDGKGEIKDDYVTKTIGDKIYYNPVDNVKVNADDDAGCTDNCKIFYVLEDKGTDYASVSLIMDRNIDNTAVAYCDQSGENPNDGQLCQADGAKAKLNETTASWTNVAVSLPTGQQIASAVNNTTWTPGGPYISGLPIWLYGNLDESSGYWTSTPYSSNSLNAWQVGSNSNLHYYSVRRDNYCGVRPVITVLKSQLESE